VRLATFDRGDGAPRVGALLAAGDEVVDLRAAAELRTGSAPAELAGMQTLLVAGRPALERVAETLDWAAGERPEGAIVALASARLLAPLPRPASIRDCMSFEAHIINITRGALGRLGPLDAALERRLGPRRSLAHRLNRTFFERPLYYKSNPASVVGTGAEVRIPAYCRQFDYELEWGIVIGTRGVDVPVERARELIAGYTIFDDFSARDIQRAEMGGRVHLGPAKGKDFDTGNAIGPVLVTPDEVPDPYGLTMLARVNGVEWSRGTTADMHWSFEEIIAYISKSETLHPGDFVGSGTCSGEQGRGCGLELGKYLEPGDEVELEAERLGVLRNRVVAG
jgi:2-keto-4-pentenoate hydratase/2-oxohepta-3-ene-1,7-dioic acid hydratase in catechol pathway